MAPYPATTIANEFLRLAKRDDSAITHMKLQKLVYLAHGWYLAATNGDPLINERVLAWDFGPVIKELYAAFAEFGRDDIDKLYWTFGSIDDQISPIEPAIDTDDDKARNIIDQVWEVYGKFSAYQLSAMTHEPSSPWDSARSLNKNVIPEPTILKHYRDLSRQPA